MMLKYVSGYVSIIIVQELTIYVIYCIICFYQTDISVIFIIYLVKETIHLFYVFETLFKTYIIIWCRSWPLRGLAL